MNESHSTVKLSMPYMRWPYFINGLAEIMAWVNNYIHGYMWVVNSHPCSNFNNDLEKNDYVVSVSSWENEILNED